MWRAAWHQWHASAYRGCPCQITRHSCKWPTWHPHHFGSSSKNIWPATLIYTIIWICLGPSASLSWHNRPILMVHQIQAPRQSRKLWIICIANIRYPWCGIGWAWISRCGGNLHAAASVVVMYTLYCQIGAAWIARSGTWTIACMTAKQHNLCIECHFASAVEMQNGIANFAIHDTSIYRICK